MISSARFRGLEHLIREAENNGAKVVGGQQWNHVYMEHGSYFEPTVVGPADNTMEIAQSECRWH